MKMIVVLNNYFFLTKKVQKSIWKMIVMVNYFFLTKRFKKSI